MTDEEWGRIEKRAIIRQIAYMIRSQCDAIQDNPLGIGMPKNIKCIEEAIKRLKEMK